MAQRSDSTTFKGSVLASCLLSYSKGRLSEDPTRPLLLSSLYHHLVSFLLPWLSHLWHMPCPVALLPLPCQLLPIMRPYLFVAAFMDLLSFTAK